MLAPTTLTTSQYGLATKPLLGFEQQLYVSTENYTNLGTFSVLAANSGSLTLNVADTAALGTTPQELLAVLDTDVLADAQMTLTVSGTDENDAPGTWEATFTPPGYAQDQSFNFPIRFAAELVAQGAAGKCKTITSVAITATAAWVNTNILILGLPSLTSYHLISTKTKLDIDPKTPMPTAIQDGRDRGRYIKGGEIDVGSCDISCKEPTSADGLSRYKGKRVTGWVKEVKEGVLNTQNIFICGLIITPKYSGSEGQEPTVLNGTGMFEKYASIPAA